MNHSSTTLNEEQRGCYKESGGEENANYTAISKFEFEVL
jgi:hypothetical protein